MADFATLSPAERMSISALVDCVALLTDTVGTAATAFEHARRGRLTARQAAALRDTCQHVVASVGAQVSTFDALAALLAPTTPSDDAEGGT